MLCDGLNNSLGGTMIFQSKHNLLQALILMKG